MPPLQTPELQSKLVYWRSRAADGTITLDEMKEAILLLRENRKAASEANAASKSGGKKASRPARSSDDMLSELEGL
jgi:hypothetical protein